MTYITRLQQSCARAGATAQVAVFDHSKLWFRDWDTKKAQVAINYKAAGRGGDPLLVDVDGDSRNEIVCRGGGFSDVALLDATGKLVWKRSGSFTSQSTALSMAVGDLDGNGEREFYVGATDGLYRLDLQGSEVWKTSDGGIDPWFEDVETFESEIPGESCVVSLTQRPGRYQPRELDFRDHHGNLIKRVRPQRELYEFRLLRWPEDDGRLHIVGRTGAAVLLLTGDGEVVWQYAIPRKFGTGHGIEACFVRWNADQDPCLAVLLGSWSAWRRSLLCLFSLEGTLLYQEVLGHTDGLLALRPPGADTSGDVLLVGDGMGRIVEYHWNRDSLSPGETPHAAEDREN